MRRWYDEQPPNPRLEWQLRLTMVVAAILMALLLRAVVDCGRFHDSDEYHASARYQEGR